MRKEKIGDVYKIEVVKNKFAFAQVIYKGLVKVFTEFYNSTTLFEDVIHNISDVQSFSVFIHIDYVTNENWIFQGTYERASKELPVFFRQDLIDFEDCVTVDVYGNKKSVKPIDCIGLERSAVWDTDHVVGRLKNILLKKDDENVKIMMVKLK